MGWWIEDFTGAKLKKGGGEEGDGKEGEGRGRRRRKRRRREAKWVVWQIQS